jgi:hypothetical protein
MGICRVGQNHLYTVYIRYFWQGNHQRGLTEAQNGQVFYMFFGL